MCFYRGRDFKRYQAIFVCTMRWKYHHLLRCDISSSTIGEVINNDNVHPYIFLQIIQTVFEKNSFSTKHNNKQGFSKYVIFWQAWVKSGGHYILIKVLWVWYCNNKKMLCHLLAAISALSVWDMTKPMDTCWPLNALSSDPTSQDGRPPVAPGYYDLFTTTARLHQLWESFTHTLLQ